jgi:hypothetical protein
VDLTIIRQASRIPASNQIERVKLRHAGYLTTRPGTRAGLYYSLPDADPAVIASDEERKDVVSASELNINDVLALVTTDATQAIQVPVLTILGEDDVPTFGPNTQGGNFDCSTGAAVALQEVPSYSPQARIHACVVPFSGHVVSLAINRRLQVADAVAWSSAFVGQRKFDIATTWMRGAASSKVFPGMTISRATVAASTKPTWPRIGENGLAPGASLLKSRDSRSHDLIAGS